MTKTIRTGYFGGSFNPIHEGHIRLADFICRKGMVDEVWFVVSPKNPLKPTADPKDAQQRFQEVQQALSAYPALIASDFEFNLPIPSYTADNLRKAVLMYPKHEFILIIGGDNLDVFEQWKEYQYLLNQFDILVYPRNGASNRIPSGWQRVTLLDAPLMDISSTQIREQTISVNNGR